MPNRIHARRIGVRLGAALAGATMLAMSAAGPALAQPSGETSPSTVQPGDVFTVIVQDCEGGGATVSLTAIGGASEAGLQTESAENEFRGRVQVPADTEPGTYELDGRCLDGSTYTATLTVAPAGAPDTGEGEPSSDGRVAVLTGAGVLGIMAAAVLTYRRRTETPGA